MPLVLVAVGLALLAAHVVRGTWVPGAIAAGVALTAALFCMPLRVRGGQSRMVAFGAGVLVALASAIPGAFSFPLGMLPWWIAGLAFVAPVSRATPGQRQVLLGGAALLGVLAMVARLGVLPPGLFWPLLAGAFHLCVQVLMSKPAKPVERPVGQRVCVFGGTFDPFHRGHRVLVEAALKANDRVLVVVAGTPPHKQAAAAERTAFHHRVAMTRLGVEGLPRTEVLELEGRRQGPSYTVDTLDQLARSYPAGTRWRLLLGADSFQEFPTWKDWEGILERAMLLVAQRPGFDLDMPPEFEGRNMPVEALDIPPVDVSASALREVLAGDGDVGEALAPAIRTYIRDHRLYLPGGAGTGAVELASSARGEALTRPPSQRHAQGQPGSPPASGRGTPPTQPHGRPRG
jgi:nicotinate-nucleotide adenylyltransferase